MAFDLTPTGTIGNLGKGVNYTPVPLDPATQGLINDQANQATQSTGQIAGLLNKNVQAQGTAMMNSGPSPAQQAAKMGGMDAAYTNQAIRNQFNQSAQKNINQLMQRNTWQAPMTQSQLLQNAAQSAMAQQQVETRNYEGLMNAYNANINARAQVVSSVLGMFGSGAAVAASSGKSMPQKDPAVAAATEKQLDATNNDYSNVAQNSQEYKAGDLANIPGSSDSDMWVDRNGQAVTQYGNGWGWYPDPGSSGPGFFGQGPRGSYG